MRTVTCSTTTKVVGGIIGSMRIAQRIENPDKTTRLIGYSNDVFCSVNIDANWLHGSVEFYDFDQDLCTIFKF